MKINMVRKIILHILEKQETVSLPLGFPCDTCTHHIISLGTPRGISMQLEIDRSSNTVSDKEKATDDSLENISHPTSAWIFV